MRDQLVNVGYHDGICYKADAAVRSPIDDVDLEILSLETSNAFQITNEAKKSFDFHKGMYGAVPVFEVYVVTPCCSKYIRKCLIHKWRLFRCDAKVMSGIPCNVTDEKTNTILHSTLLDTQNNCECLEKTLQILELLNTSLKAFPVIGATHGSGREAVFGRPRQKAMSRTRKKIPGSPIKDFSKSSATEVLLKKGEANIKALHALIMTILSKLSQEGT